MHISGGLAGRSSSVALTAMLDTLDNRLFGSRYRHVVNLSTEQSVHHVVCPAPLTQKFYWAVMGLYWHDIIFDE